VGFSCSYDFGKTVFRNYHGPFAFSDDIRQVTIDLSGELIRDNEADLRVA
jgi:hypothetical protein